MYYPVLPLFISLVYLIWFDKFAVSEEVYFISDIMSENNLSEKSCRFLGHRNTPQNIESLLTETIEKLILEQNVRFFYVGNQTILTIWFFYFWKNLKNLIRRLNIPLFLPICRQKLRIKNMGTFSWTLTVWNMFPSVLLFFTEMTGWLSVPILLYAISDIILAVHISLWKNQKVS